MLGLIAEFTDRMDSLLVGADDTRARIWGSAIYQALKNPILNATEASDQDLRFELELIGRQMLRGYHSAHRKARRSAG